MARVHADLVLLNAKLVTLDPAQHVHSAMAILNGRILALGADEEIEALVGPATKRIDLGQRTALKDTRVDLTILNGEVVYER